MVDRPRIISTALVTFAVMSSSLTPKQVAAHEPGASNNYRPGFSLGIPLGANPPPGLHLSTYVNAYSGEAVDGPGDRLGTRVSTVAVAPMIAWAPRMTVLGASYMAFAVKPIVSIDLNNAGDMAASYLGGGLDLTAYTAYNTNTENPTTRYRSGDQVFLDLTATKMFGAWEFGAVDYYSTQTTADEDSGHYFAPAFIDVTTDPTVFAVGALVGHQFGPVLLKAHCTREAYARDTTMGDSVGLSISLRN